MMRCIGLMSLCIITKHLIETMTSHEVPVIANHMTTKGV